MIERAWRRVARSDWLTDLILGLLVLNGFRLVTDWRGSFTSVRFVLEWVVLWAVIALAFAIVRMQVTEKHRQEADAYRRLKLQRGPYR